MTHHRRTARGAATALLVASGVAAALLTSPLAAAEPGATGPKTWCPGQVDPFGDGPLRPNWDWNACHTYWTVYGVPGNVATYIWEGDLPPAQIPLSGLSRPTFNCGLFYCQDPGGHYTEDPRIPAP